MNTAAKPNFAISAKYLGPVFSLDGELTKNAQNLIFARNGTGKSFLSRAFRYLDLYGQGNALDDAALHLVSDEAPDGKGHFAFSRGPDAVGALTLEKVGDKAAAHVTDTIFHVFSEDFVHDELRERSFVINGEIENQISVDSANIKLKDGQDEVSLNPGLIDGTKYARPELLVLTHSSYFFNISVTNKVVESNAAFALHPEKGVHKLASLKKYVAPFQEQLRDIYEIANGSDPDDGTANSIRSVLEAIGRFCRPDKSESLTNFIQHLASDEGISIKSVLINTMCHGTYLEETPPPDDLRMACQETMSVVERFAAGQLEIIKSASAVKGN
jgi:hypothetical protein